MEDGVKYLDGSMSLDNRDMTDGVYAVRSGTYAIVLRIAGNRRDAIRCSDSEGDIRNAAATLSARFDPASAGLIKGVTTTFNFSPNDA